jgi:DME family drug/metabolite transporter
MLVILAAGLWSTVGLSVKLVPQGALIPPEILGMARTLLAGPLIILVCLLTGTGGFARLASIGVRRLAVFAVMGLVFQICLFRAFAALGVTLTVALTVCLPPIIATLRAQWRGARSGYGPLASLGLAVTGLVLCSVGQLAQGAGQGSLSGLGLAVIASVAFVLMTDAARDLTREVSPVVVAGVGLSLTGLLFCLIVPWVVAEPTAFLATALSDWQIPGLILYLAVVPTALAYICYCAGIARCRSTAVGLTASMIEPAIAALLAFLLLGERLSGVETAGCLMMAASLVVLVAAEALAPISQPVRPMAPLRPALP